MKTAGKKTALYKHFEKKCKKVVACDARLCEFFVVTFCAALFCRRLLWHTCAPVFSRAFVYTGISRASTMAYWGASLPVAGFLELTTPLPTVHEARFRHLVLASWLTPHPLCGGPAARTRIGLPISRMAMERILMGREASRKG